MKTIGMIGGLSWESSSVYYQLINREMQNRLGGLHSAKAMMYSFDFGEIATLQDAGKWDDMTGQMVTVGKRLARGGADFLMICCNTMHLMSDEVERAAEIPLLHIADPVGEEIGKAGFKRVGLIGSCHTTSKRGILIDRLENKFGIEILVPGEAERAEIHHIIVEELCQGKVTDSARQIHREVMANLVRRGAQGIILGCTEIPLLVKAEDATVPLYDTTTLHALAAVDNALQ